MAPDRGVTAVFQIFSGLDIQFLHGLATHGNTELLQPMEKRNGVGYLRVQTAVHDGADLKPERVV